MTVPPEDNRGRNTIQILSIYPIPVIQFPVQMIASNFKEKFRMFLGAIIADILHSCESPRENNMNTRTVQVQRNITPQKFPQRSFSIWAGIFEGECLKVLTYI